VNALDHPATRPSDVPAEAPRRDPWQGKIVGDRYRIDRLLASGGMGAVYRAHHTISERPVALKIIQAALGQDPAGARRFKREAGAASAIDHPGIVEVLDAGVEAEQGVLFLVMELLEGEDLRARLRDEATTAKEAVRWIRALLDPLAAAHAKGFVHRDLKPENVFLAKDTEGNERVKLLDFGIARRADAQSSTLTGAALGTPYYMSPEQATSAKSATAASDVWSVGVMLYEAVVGEPPFRGETVHATVIKACSEPHVPVLELTPEVGAAFGALVDRCLAKRPEERPPDAHALAMELDAALGGAHLSDAPPRSGSFRAASPLAFADTATTEPEPASEEVVARGALETLAADRNVRRGLLAFVVLAASALVGGIVLAATVLTDAPEAVAEPTPMGAAPPSTPVEPIASPTPLPTLVTREGAGVTLDVPADWEAPESMLPGVAARFAEPATQPGGIRVTVTAKLEPFAGTTRQFVDLGLSNMAAVSQLHMTRDVSVDGAPGVEAEATYHAQDPPFRGLSRAAVQDGTGVVLFCHGPVDRFDEVRPLCRAILDSFRRVPEATPEP